jgi:hypothetical protein
MAIFLAVSTSSQGETVLTRADIPAPHDIPQGIHTAECGQYRALLGPFSSPLAAHYIWWLWAKRGVKRLTTKLIAAAEQAAQNEDDLLWDIERETFLVEEGLTTDERSGMAVEYDPATPEPISVCWLFPAQAQAAR